MRPERNGFIPLEIKISNRRSKKFLTGFTIVELLTVLAIIAIMVGILVPTVSFVRNTAREAKQKTQLATIDMALMAFKGDYGDYPPSNLNVTEDYCGAQKLAEALVGWDLLGFHPDSAWRADGYDGLTPTGWWTYDPDGQRDEDSDGILDTLNERTGPYLETTTANAFTLRQLFGNNDLGWTHDFSLHSDRFVLCDSFTKRSVFLTTPGGQSRRVNVGLPILYYRANTSNKRFRGGQTYDLIYNYQDNFKLVSLKADVDGTNYTVPGTSYIRERLLSDDGEYLYSDEYKLIDPRVTAVDWPYRPDSYILISAGVDGLYGTNDDICNF